MENYVGKRLDGRYEMLDIIGVGGMAVVYKAYDSIDDRIVAVKILKDEYLANEEFRRRFKNESKAIAVMSHKNIVKVFDVSFGDRLQYIVMEYIEGITLKEYIEQKGVLPWKEAMFFVIQILKALQHAHDKGIVHRDVKPQNIMLLENGMIKVTDFGIARFSHGETRTMTEKAIGSVHYISPEQAKGELTDEKADIYSVGVVLYEMLTGKLPFEAESAVSVALMQVNNKPVLPRELNPNLPIGFEQITMKAMQKSARDRYQSAAEFLMDLEEFRRNPSIKFDYRAFYTDDGPTRYVDKIKVDNEDVKTVPPVANAHKKLDSVGVKTVDAVQDIPAKRVNTRVVAVIAGVAVAVIIFIGILLLSMIKNGTLTLGVGKKIEVDNFVGMNYVKEIQNNEEYHGKFDFEPIYESFTDGEEGCVFKQDPEAGTQVTEGYTIRLYIAKSGEGQILADYSDENYKSAQNDLEALGFKVTLKPVTDSKVDVGLVVKTEPEAGTSVLLGDEITIYYSASADSKLFKMPDLTGKTLSEAKKIIKKHNLVLSKTETVDSNVEKDRVTMQSPGEGSPVQEGDTVILTVSSGEVVLNKTINLPEDIGTVEVEVYLDSISAVKSTVNTNTTNKFTFELKSSNPDARVDIYINGQVYYQVNADFSKDPVKLYGEKTQEVSFYLDVVGLTEVEALETLSNAGYTNVSTVEIVSDEPVGTVVAQSPVSSSAPNLDKTAMIVLSIAVSELSSTPEETQPVELV